MKSFLKLKISFHLFVMNIFFCYFAVSGSHTNNSGDFVRSVIITRYGPEIVELAKKQANAIKVLESLSIEWIDLEATLRTDLWQLVSPSEMPKDNEDSRADAVFDGAKVLLNEQAWSHRIDLDLIQNNLNQKKLNLMVVAHEMLRLAKIDDTDYVYSKKLFESPDSVSLNATVLEEVAVAINSQGLDEKEARKYCEQRARKYIEAYFDVVCEIHRNVSKEDKTAVAFYTTSKVIGTASYSSGSASSGLAYAGVRSGYSSANALVIGSSSSYASFSEPRVVTESVPYTYSYSVEKVMYGFRILGIGRLDSLEWIVLESSHKQNRNFGNLTYPSAEIAARECLLSLMEARTKPSTAFRYYRAICGDPVLEENGNYSFIIKTQNPFLSSNFRRDN